MENWWIWFIIGFCTATYIWHRLIRKWINIGVVWLVHRSEHLLKKIDGYDKEDE